MSLLIAGLLAFAQGAAAKAAAPTLGIGDTAPAFVVEKWVRGEPIRTFEPGKVYVVEFWATWCGPCIAAMPHLSDLSEKYAGKARFVGVNVWDRQADEKVTNSPKMMKRINDFMKEQGKSMRYDVAVDGVDDHMSKNWLFAAGQNGIPSSFIVQDGKIAWIGHPMSMDVPLEKIVAGTWNVEEAKKQAALESEKRAKMMEEFRAWSARMGERAAANDLRSFYDEAGKSPMQYPLFASIQTVAQNHPTFALRALGDKIKEIQPNILAQICVDVAMSPKATEQDKKKATEMAEAAGTRAADSQKTETYGMVARLYVALNNPVEARKAIKKARAGMKHVSASQRPNYEKFIESVEKSIKE